MAYRNDPTLHFFMFLDKNYNKKREKMKMKMNTRNKKIPFDYWKKVNADKWKWTNGTIWKIKKRRQMNNFGLNFMRCEILFQTNNLLTNSHFNLLNSNKNIRVELSNYLFIYFVEFKLFIAFQLELLIARWLKDSIKCIDYAM